MENLSYAILILSILVQIAATILAVRLVWITNKIGAWAFVAMGITLMAFRRGSTLYHCITQGLTPDLSTEIIALISSGFLLLGLSLIGPLFLGLKRRSEKLLMLSEEKYRLLANTVPAVVFRGYVDGSVDLFDDKVEEMVGYDKELFNSRQLKWTDLICPEDQETAKAAFIQALKGKGIYVREYRVKSKEGRIIWIQERSQIFLNERVKVDYISGVFYDITDCRLAEEALHNSKEELTSTVQILEKRNQELTLLSEMGDLLQSCYNAEEAYGVVGSFLQRIFHEEAGGLLVIDPDTKLLKVVFTWGGFHPEREVFPKEECWALRNGRVLGTNARHFGLCRHPDAPKGVDFLCLPMVAQGDALGVLRIHCQDVTRCIDESKRQLTVTVAEHMTLALANLLLRESLRYQSIRDALTGLYNRRYLEEALEREIYRAVRHQRPLAIIMLDVDHFKQFNDEFGHDAGDTLLREMGSFLKAAIRQTDIACRYGGEEFLMILPETTRLGAVQKAEKLREKFKNLNIMHQGQLLRRSTISLGVAAFPEHGSTVKILIQMADKALYQAKAAGRDRVEVAPTYREEVEEEAAPEFMAQAAESADLFSNGPKASF
jgi:diguanylate cyclase (GGDEF)-like protein/PAS domain S-box-containing protein